jgi:hypothetical protein
MNRQTQLVTMMLDEMTVAAKAVRAAAPPHPSPARGSRVAFAAPAFLSIRRSFSQLQISTRQMIRVIGPLSV